MVKLPRILIHYPRAFDEDLGDTDIEYVFEGQELLPQFLHLRPLHDFWLATYLLGYPELLNMWMLFPINSWQQALFFSPRRLLKSNIRSIVSSQSMNQHANNQRVQEEQI